MSKVDLWTVALRHQLVADVNKAHCGTGY